MAATFTEAYDSARTGHGTEAWNKLCNAEQCVVIYREMKRIDAEHVASSEREYIGADQSSRSQWLTSA